MTDNDKHFFQIIATNNTTWQILIFYSEFMKKCNSSINDRLTFLSSSYWSFRLKIACRLNLL